MIAGKLKRGQTSIKTLRLTAAGGGGGLASTKITVIKGNLLSPDAYRGPGVEGLIGQAPLPPDVYRYL
jgi:hypothetical protein